ncbi:HAD family phosphatase [Aeromicrobium senzhongii]|uniref:HAD family phosphatase n=1 Tax=Aeromicrobium senzhongii TaxID=2663859 RepID=A0ABX6SYB4_9ACTN|nr:HAD family hydrolase [Aeromicrobium senzhongii]MTB89674.1 Cof-type HAD-IIB family hydrolase [Aeromicrobium senzhongii]QNL94200.1 HAD family phosphatase [Aeromicrobium senzhongii]
MTAPDIRLVVADLDGTLLDEHKRLPDGTIDLIRDLQAAGVAFAPASGRQWATLTAMFEPVSDGLVIIAENGSYVTDRGTEVAVHPLDAAWVSTSVARIQELADEGVDLGIVVCGVKSAWITRTDRPFLDQVEPYYRRLEVTDDLTTIDDTIIKLAVHDFGDLEAVTAPFLREYCHPNPVAVSGAHWVDVMAEGVDKGLAVRELQKAMGIDATQTMAFGDYLNDYEMLQAADWSFAMGNAHPDIIDVANYTAPPNTENGVITTVRTVLGI